MLGRSLFRDDAHAVFAIEAQQRLPPVRAVGAFERRAQRLQLRQLGVAELADEEFGAVLPEHDDAGEHRQRDHGDEQQHEAPEQRARQECHAAPSPLPSPTAAACPSPSGAARSGTYT